MKFVIPEDCGSAKQILAFALSYETASSIINFKIVTWLFLLMLLLQRVMVKTVFLFVIECSSLLHNFETFRKHSEDVKTHNSDFVEFSEVIDLEQVNLEYSTKNIPIPSVRDYCQTLIGETRSFIRRMQWDAYFLITVNPW